MGYGHEEISELLGAYALDAVDADEAEAVETHLSTCPRCRAEVADHREVAAKMAYSGAPAPEGLWTRIVESLEETPPALEFPVSGGPPFVTTSEPAPVVDLASRRGVRKWLPLSAAAALLVVVGLVAGLVVAGDGSTGKGQLAVSEASIGDVARRVLNDPAAVKVQLKSLEDETLTATAAVEEDGSGYLLGTSLPALDETQTYQLWGVRGDADAVISLGLLGHSPDVVAFHLDENIKALVITAEVAGGVPQSSNPALLVGNVV